MKTKLIDYIIKREPFYSVEDLNVFSLEDLLAIKSRMQEEAELKELREIVELDMELEEEGIDMYVRDLSGGSIF